MVSDKALLLSNIRYVQAGGFEPCSFERPTWLLAKNVVVVRQDCRALPICLPYWLPYLPIVWSRQDAYFAYLPKRNRIC